LGILLHTSTAWADTIQVRAGDNLQAAINAAQPGDTLLLAPGATFSGNFILPVKSGSEFITIRTAPGGALPPDGLRINPAYAPLLARIQSPNNGAAIATAPGSHHWRLQLLEVPATRLGYGDIIQIGDGSSAQNSLAMVPHDFDLDRLYIHGDPEFGQKRGIALNAAAVTIRNCYISDIKAIGFDTQAIGGWNGPGPFTIENNYLEASGENLLLGGADPGINGLVTTGVLVRHNYFTRPMSWRNPVVSDPTGVTAAPAGGGSLPAGTYTYRVVARKLVGGGSTARSTASTSVTAAVAPGGAVTVKWTAVPGATEYYVYGRSSSAMHQYWVVAGTSFTDTGGVGQSGNVPTTVGDRWLVKNLFELKNARNVRVEFNIFENNWAHGQAGYAILLTPRNQGGTCTWCVVSDVTFESNVIRNVAAGFNILGYDDLAPSQQTTGIVIRNTLAYELRLSLGGSGWFALISASPSNIVMDHNTIDSEGSAVIYVAGGSVAAPQWVAGFQFTNNAARHNEYGINGTNYGFGNGIITNYFPGGVVRGNWLQGGIASRYPADHYFDGTFAGAFVDVSTGNFTPVAGGVLSGRATDGGTLGVDMAALTLATRTVAAGGVALKRPAAPRNVRTVVVK
jgi:hypothetical protein